MNESKLLFACNAYFSSLLVSIIFYYLRNFNKIGTREYRFTHGIHTYNTCLISLIALYYQQPFAFLLNKTRPYMHLYLLIFHTLLNTCTHRILMRKLVKCSRNLLLTFYMFLEACNVREKRYEYLRQNFIEVYHRGISVLKDAAINSVNQPQVIVDFYFTIAIIKMSREDCRWAYQVLFLLFLFSPLSIFPSLFFGCHAFQSAFIVLTFFSDAMHAGVCKTRVIKRKIFERQLMLAVVQTRRCFTAHSKIDRSGIL